MFEQTYRWGRSWEPWRELNRLQEEVNRLFSGAVEGRTCGCPQMRVWTNQEEAILQVQVPGVRPDEVAITVLGDSVTIAGKRQQDTEKEATYHRREREFGDFTRTLQMPFRVESDKVQAEYRQGLLLVHLPRATADRPRKIQVKAD